MGKPMNSKEQRKQAAEKVRIRLSEIQYSPPRAIQRRAEEIFVDAKELLTLLADAERENDALRRYVSHEMNCAGKGLPETDGDCTCGLDRILKQEGE